MTKVSFNYCVTSHLDIWEALVQRTNSVYRVHTAFFFRSISGKGIFKYIFQVQKCLKARKQNGKKNGTLHCFQKCLHSRKIIKCIFLLIKFMLKASGGIITERKPTTYIVTTYTFSCDLVSPHRSSRESFTYLTRGELPHQHVEP